MGIHRFFPYFKTRFASSIINMKRDEKLSDFKVTVDNLAIDMNGLIHNSAQYVFKYGNNKPQARFLNGGNNIKPVPNTISRQKKVYEDVCKSVMDLIETVQPQKKLILCVDGVAPLSKEMQQRSRRFKSAKEQANTKQEFDNCAISPGTVFMDFLTKYLDWFIRKQLSENEKWRHLQVVFSNEKVHGEGEQKIMSYARDHPSESYCLVGMDADLIMIALGSHIKNFYILREDNYQNSEYDFYLINIDDVRQTLLDIMYWKNPNKRFSEKCAINDFVLMCFTTGNDFLPHIPSIEIMEGGIDVLLDVYKNVGESYGHLTRIVKEKVYIVKKALEIYMGSIAQYEKGLIEEKINRPVDYFPDEILNDCISFSPESGKKIIDYERYKKRYYEVNMYGKTIKEACHNYLEGMMWVLQYYTTHVPSWKWHYTAYYAPFAGDLAHHLPSFKFAEYPSTQPHSMFQQLMSIIAPPSAKLLPYPLNTLLTDETSPIRHFYPLEFKIDLSGKRKEWEGKVILPFINQEEFDRVYMTHISSVSEKDLKRNIPGRTFVYSYSVDTCYTFRSYYSDIENCHAKITSI